MVEFPFDFYFFHLLFSTFLILYIFLWNNWDFLWYNLISFVCLSAMTIILVVIIEFLVYMFNLS